jgi:hypothetical protein
VQFIAMKAFSYPELTITTTKQPKEIVMTILKLGPAGGSGGGSFDDSADPDRRIITSVQVFSGDTIDHITVVYTLGKTITSPVQHGESGGNPNPAFNLDTNGGELLTKVEGFAGFFDGTFEIMGLSFTTNFGRQSPLFGHRTNAPFVFEAPPKGEIFAFFGRKGFFVDALGVFVKLP